MNFKKKVPLFIIEEHHENYIIWKYAIANNLINSENNCLLHIDEHSDMGTPNTNYSIYELNNSLNSIKAYTYNELNIATFIIPAVFEKIINKIYWLKQKHNKTRKRPVNLYVRTLHNNGKKFVVEKTKLLSHFSNSDTLRDSQIVTYGFYKIHTEDLPRLKNVILDIDLDYFSCIQDPLKKTLKIEITENEYLGFCNNKYHRLRYFDFEKIIVQKENGKFYYCLNLFDEKYESPLKNDFKKITSLIELLVDKLRRNRITPQIITICRSRFSGYTPDDQWSFIEENLQRGLSELYDIKSVSHVSQL